MIAHSAANDYIVYLLVIEDDWYVQLHVGQGAWRDVETLKA